MRVANYQVGRRAFLGAMAGLVVSPPVVSQPSGPRIQVRTFNHLGLLVSDPEDSIDFYQRLFGLPIQARHGPTALLRIGSGPQFLAIGRAESAAPGISHLCLGVENFDADDLVTKLENHRLATADGSGGGLSGGPMRIRVQSRGPEAGGSPDGTPHVYFGDPDGIVVQLQHPSYCGGASVLGNLCDAPQPADGRPLIAVRDIGHFTMNVSDATQSTAFYQALFGLDVRRRGPVTVLGVGSGAQFIQFSSIDVSARGPATFASAARIDHVGLNVASFNPDRQVKALESLGVKPRESAQTAPRPLRYFVKKRVDNPGGAKVAAPELYFTDPDGILIQLQDASYYAGLESACE